jgi:small subunit ribosomal protein S15Ae|uniref:30S ribosomal protein S8, chloroplastic n=1 Tax=Picea sitchensis TaxID=3332 RepID=A9NNR7_PICSI|nr:unknown [Picea sitchensis]ABK22561.1 unknown [Picea sitchensis]ABK23973.1 unknown [Picea sitchensis]ABK24678.1 unknown [Picea sitchensis]
MGMRILNEALRKMVNAEKRGFTKVQLQPMSLLMVNYLNVMKSRGYIKDFEVFEPHRVGRITVELEGRIKDCKALSYRQDIRAKDIESYKSRILPTRQWGYVVITTTNGVLDHEEAQRQNVGGRVLGYFY